MYSAYICGIFSSRRYFTQGVGNSCDAVSGGVFVCSCTDEYISLALIELYINSLQARSSCSNAVAMS